MTAEKILVNGEGLRGISQKLYSMVDSLERIEATLSDMVSETENHWKGKAPKEAKQCFII